MSIETLENPSQQWLRGILGGPTSTSLSVNLVSSVAVITAGALTIRPLGWSGQGLVGLVLLVVNSVLLLSRHVSEDSVSPRSRIWLLVVGAFAAAALLGLERHGSAYLFGFYVAGHAGFRLSRDPAILIGVLSSVLNGGVLALHLGPGHLNVPWEVGAATGVSVLLGMTNRSQQVALDAAVLAADAAERATEAEAREAVLAERGRIARDVHDVLAHSLAGINMQLELADALLDTGDIEQVRAATQRAQSLVRESLVESQRTVRALREGTLPLVETLTAMLVSSGHPDTLSVVGDIREVETRVCQNLIRIAQEALTNAARHGVGGEVAATLTFEASAVALDVVNSAGSSAATGAGTGLGLVGMRERAALLGGEIEAGPVTSGPFAGGWRVHAIIPL